MHRGIIGLRAGDTLGQVAKIMVDHEIHAVVSWTAARRSGGVADRMVLAAGPDLGAGAAMLARE